MSLLDVLKGLMVTGRTMGKKPVTVQYPEHKKDYAPRYHGRHQLNRYEDGLEKCIGCELCAWACPADAIYVQGAENTPEARYSPGERYAIDYQINYLRCIFCGLCIEACPTRALTMTAEDWVSGTSREEMIFTKDRLLAPTPSGGHETPHTDEEVRGSGLQYYGGPQMTSPVASAERAERVEAHGGAARAGLGSPPEQTQKPGDPTVSEPGEERPVDAGEPRAAFSPEARTEDFAQESDDVVTQARTDRQVLPKEQDRPS